MSIHSVYVYTEFTRNHLSFICIKSTYCYNRSFAAMHLIAHIHVEIAWCTLDESSASITIYPSLTLCTRPSLSLDLSLLLCVYMYLCTYLPQCLQVRFHICSYLLLPSSLSLSLFPFI